jgi:hypothetical protein
VAQSVASAGMWAGRTQTGSRSKALDDGDVMGPARQRFDPKHRAVLQRPIPWPAAKVVPEPRPTAPLARCVLILVT